MSFGFVVPLAAWLLLLLLLLRHGQCLRSAFLISSVAWGTAVTLLTEALSVFGALNYPSLLFCWSALLVPLAVLFVRVRGAGIEAQVKAFFFENKPMILSLAFILLSTLCIAVLAPPNNGDSMTYHMSRVMHWIQNESVRHYPTNEYRQLDMNPWAEFAILHLQLLSQGEYLANLVQWFSMVGCVVGASLIARHFSASAFGQVLSALVAATIPMAILQASSTQNDLVVSFWLVCFVYFGLTSMEKKSWPLTFLMACSLGLALLTKGTAGIFAAPFILYFLARDCRISWRNAASRWLAVGTIVVFINAGHWHRNFSLFHNPLHSGMLPFSNDRITAAVITSNAVRNIALHILTPSRPINAYMEKGVRSFHSLLGITYNDPASTWMDDSLEGLRLLPSEDGSGNPLHLLLYLPLLLLLLRKKERGELRWYGVCVVAGFLLFGALLRWQACHSRLQLPLFILFAPVAGIILSELRKAWIARSAAALLTFATLPWIFCNTSRPLYRPNLLSRQASVIRDSRRLLYFNTNVEMAGPYLDVIDEINRRGIAAIGLDLHAQMFEYPIWMLTRKNGLDGPRIEHVKVRNVSRSLDMPPFKPDVVVVVDEDGSVQLQDP